jgi:protein-S-isoprenylcysteine O-methyltransferase Ste14
MATMRTVAASVGSAAFYVAAPGTVVGLVPWSITRWQLRAPLPHWGVARAVGVVLIVVGLVPATHAFVEFTRAGGTPMPLAPTQRLVVTGPNRYLRNPMYAGLLLVIVGQALLFGSAALLVYAVAFWVVTAAFVRAYEEPTLAARYGDGYAAYRRAVPAWWPRRHAWTPDGSGTGARHT